MRLASAVGAILLTAASCPTQDAPAGWKTRIRERLAAREASAALAIAERRLAEAPGDLEARGWRAHLLAWAGRWREAEDEYRRVLDAAPGDVELLLGLSDVLAWQQRTDEALATLNRARELGPVKAEVEIRRGRALRALGRSEEARTAFRRALALDPSNAEAQVGLASLEPEPRHELRVGTDFDFFNFADKAQAFALGLHSRLNARWATGFDGNFYRRFGQDAVKFTAVASCRLSQRDSLAAGGAVGRDQGVIPKGEAFFEYGHVFNFGPHNLFRGIELGYRQHWLWYRDARILALRTSVVFYLPRDWSWSIHVTNARSRFPFAAAAWQPSGMTRLTIPVHRRVNASLFYAVGTENFARADQIGLFSARTFGGDARYRLRRRQEVTGYVLFQDRSQGRTQASFGLSYALHF